ncbi:hypothetical protein [Litorisediminicola beolgyonensis]|uniref:Uncharacterized protein n=1 Tax=Litorisediminicola beolgyonensis TaxID=1173614 RepID=A0ABW3ZG22_9RHOB
MSRKFIAAVLSVSLVTAGVSASPARAAEAEDIARALGGIATVLVIGKLIRDARDEDNAKTEAERRKDAAREAEKERREAHARDRERRQDWQDWQDWQDRGRYDRWEGGSRWFPKGHPLYDWQKRDRGDLRRAPLPAACLLDTRSRSGRRTEVLGVRCVERSYASARHLPDSCLTRVDTPHGLRVGYEAQCLRERGWSLSRR